MEFSRFLGREVDVVILNTASPFLRFVVIKEGKLIYEKDKSQRIDFELKSLNEYFDYKPILELYRQKILSS
ncbi:MAG: nucleotidyltransferase domain-containing protein [Candidatus Pacebacteria bacterium]|nr:nucleotidyltransferase domain-containing protein [Candidatus Paceibacterota bacterium]